VGQAEKELSLTAQRRSAEEFAARHEAVIDHHYLEPGASGTDTHRTVFNELLGDALRPGSTIAVIVVHHTSRFTRDATHARVVKKELRRAGVRVLSVTQELSEDPLGTLTEGLFECIDQLDGALEDAADALLGPSEQLGALGPARQGHSLVEDARHVRLLAVHQEELEGLAHHACFERGAVAALARRRQKHGFARLANCQALGPLRLTVLTQAGAELLDKGSHDFGALATLCDQRRTGPRRIFPIELAPRRRRPRRHPPRPRRLR
jgi:hypothetical protein